MSEIVERVARVLCGPDPDERWHLYEPKAREVIEAMMTPTPEMLHAATMIAPTWDDNISLAKWQAMLSAALTP